MSPPAVAERVRRLETARVISGYHAALNTERVGLPIRAMIRLSVVGDLSKRITADIAKLPQVVECHRGTGADCFILQVVVASIAGLEKLVDKLTKHGQLTTSILLSTPVPRRPITRETLR